MDDLLKLHVNTVDPEDPDGVYANFDAYRMRVCLRSHLRNQTEDRLPKLLSIRKRDSEVADYLEHLEAQITQLAARMSTSSDLEFDDTQQETAVNMSATGLRFSSDMVDLAPGQLLELGMLLSTSGTEIVALAEVLRVEPAAEVSGDDSPKVLVSTHFATIHPDDREAIIRHMAKLQMLQLQARRSL